MSSVVKLYGEHNVGERTYDYSVKQLTHMCGGAMGGRPSCRLAAYLYDDESTLLAITARLTDWLHAIMGVLIVPRKPGLPRHVNFQMQGKAGPSYG